MIVVLLSLGDDVNSFEIISYILSYDHVDPKRSRSLLCSLYVYVVFSLIFLHLGASRSENVINGVVYVSIKAISPIKVLAMTLTWRHTLYSCFAHTHTFQYIYITF